MVLVGTLVLSVMFRGKLSEDARFHILKPYYAYKIEKIYAGIQDGSAFQRDGQLIAFYWKRGVVDNWVGLIYDPADSLSMSGSKKIFGGDLIAVRRLSNNWFLCSFT